MMLTLLRKLDIFDGWSNFYSFVCFVLLIISGIYSILKYVLIKVSKKEINQYLTAGKIRKLKYYVPTMAQFDDPCEKQEIDEINTDMQFDLYRYFKNEFKKDQKGKLFMVLADSGMGKSTFLQILYLRYKRKIIKSRGIEFFPLSNRKDLSDIAKIEHKPKKILLLDALDEDSYAIENYKQRINDIVNVSLEYYKVIITCRTQFFPNAKSEPKKTGFILYGADKKKCEFKKIYLSPFSEYSINKYLRKRFRTAPDLVERAEKIILKTSNLMARPLLLNHIDVLLSEEKDFKTRSDIYDTLIMSWINYESVDKELLVSFTLKVVLYLYKNDKFYILQDEIEQLCSDNEKNRLEPIFAKSRSLLNRNGLGEYKFAHKSIYEYLISKAAIEDSTIRKGVLENIKEKKIDGIFYFELCSEYVINFPFEEGDNLNYMLFSYQDFYIRHDFPGLNLIGVYWKGTDLSYADLSNANLSEADLSGTKLNKANLSQADLRGANLNGANLSEANLSEANLSETDLSEAELIGANLIEANLNKANLSRANISKGEKFDKTDPQEIELRKRGLRELNIMITDLTKVNLSEANLSEANLSGANLSGANLSKGNLSGANLSGANLSGANLHGADLSRANLRGAILKGAILNETNLDGAELN